MKITTVSYQKTYSIGPYLTDKIGLEASLDDKESVADVLDNLRGKADEWHKAEHPHLYQESNPEPSLTRFPPPLTGPAVMETIDYKKWDQFEIAIENAQTLEELETIVRSTDTFPVKLLSIINAKREYLKFIRPA